MNIKCVRLITGEELLGDVTAESSESVTIKKPLQVILQHSPQGLNVGFVPFLPYSDETEFTFEVRNILLVHTPNRELSNQYRTIHGDGIVIANEVPSPSKLSLIQ